MRSKQNLCFKVLLFGYGWVWIEKEELEEFPFCCREVVKRRGYIIIFSDDFMINHWIWAFKKAGSLICRILVSSVTELAQFQRDITAVFLNIYRNTLWLQSFLAFLQIHFSHSLILASWMLTVLVLSTAGFPPTWLDLLRYWRNLEPESPFEKCRREFLCREVLC